MNKLGRVSYACSTPGKGNDTPLVHELVDTSSDVSGVHPSRYCHSCYCTLLRMRKARQDEEVYRTSLVPHVWSAHSEVGCSTCTGRKAGGRPKKKQRVTGCPSYITKHLHTVSTTRYRSLAPLTRDRFLPTSQGGVCIDDLTCKSCHHVLDEVLESCTLSLSKTISMQSRALNARANTTLLFRASQHHLLSL